jgi:hypothetical protein
VALPGAYAPSGIALGIMGSTRPFHHIEVTTLREGFGLKKEKMEKITLWTS